jgi:hypothetical protein
MRGTQSSGLASRIVVVVALGFAAGFLGRYLVHLGDSGEYGWFAYTPLNSPPPAARIGFEPWQKLLIWLGLIAVWAFASAWILRRRHTPSDTSD